MKVKTTNQTLLIEKYLPHNFLAEKMILSCLLINPEAVESVSQLISVETFYFTNHQDIYRAILTMSKRKLLIDVLTVATFLQEEGLLKKIGGVQVLLELVSQVPNLTYLEEYIRLVKEKCIRRSLIKLGYEIIHSSYVTNIALENILIDLEAELAALNSQMSKPKIFSSGQVLNNIFIQLKEKFLNPGLPGVSSGFKNLDLLTQGFQRSDLVIIAGRPSMGKTALSLTIALNVIQISRLPVMFFSLEMSKEQIMYRLLAMETGIDQARLKSGQLYQNDWIKLNKAIRIISKLPLFIDDSPNLSIKQIRLKVKTLVSEQKQIGLIIIDYLQLLDGSKTQNENRVEELSKITRQLKIVAREFSVPIVSLSQLSRSVETRIDRRPILSDLRESGSIEQDADLVLMLSRSQSNVSTNLNFESVDLIIAKHRNGPTGVVNLTFSKRQTKFLE